jgi:small subunit ribosomal protein S17
MTPQTTKRRLKGTVVSDKMDKTVVVRVDRTKQHPKYHKRFVISRRFLAHDATNQYHPGDQVVIEETRPLSAKKRWNVIRKV